MIFANWDTDQDRRVSRGEFQTCWTGAGWRSAMTAFTAFDEDGDGYLASDEMFGGQYLRWDRNRNGVLEADEWPWFQPEG